VEPLKLTEPHHMFHGTLGFRGTPVEEHWYSWHMLGCGSAGKFYFFVITCESVGTVDSMCFPWQQQSAQG